MVDGSIHSPHRAALMVQSHRFSIIWIIPIVAAIAAGWLGWRSYMSNGPTIHISFENGAGIEAGRTRIRYKDADLGSVESVKLAKDLSHVTVTARMLKTADPYLTEGARFLMVRPSLTAKDISGIGTLISGGFIEFVPGKKDSKYTKHFTGEQSAVLLPANGPGAMFTLHAAQLGSIQQGTAVYFHGARVGEVLGYTLSDKDGSATVYIFIHDPHNALVHTGTRFWNTSGISVAVGSTGLKIQLESIQSLLTGGIAFDVPPNAEMGEPAAPKTNFTLYSTEANADDAVYTQRIRFLLHFSDPVPGLITGSAVRMQGLAAGQVTDVHIEYDAAHNRITVPVTIEIEVDRLKLTQNSTAADYKENTYALFRKLVQDGLRAQMGSDNLLTGQKIINLNIIPGTSSASLIEGGIYPEIPTVDSADIDGVLRSAKNMLNTANTLLGHANSAVSENDNGGDLAGTLREIRNAARSVRVLTDYLEAHPEAVLRGKPKDDNP